MSGEKEGEGMRKHVTLTATLAMVLAFTVVAFAAPAMAEDYPCGDP